MQGLNPRMRKTLLSLLAVLVVALGGQQVFDTGTERRLEPASPADRPPNTTTFSDTLSGRMIRVDAKVKRVLKDDNEGSRHQRFLIETADGTSILVAHNIDLAPRVPGPHPGSMISLYGEYEWNEKGGVLHWTHHALRGDHEAGWVEYRGERYQ